MVYIKPVLASAVAFTLVSSVAALPAQRMLARQDAPPPDDTSNPPPESYPSKRDGPMVVQAKSLQAAKRGYVGGGHAQGARKLKQAPLMKVAKLVRSKRDVVEARDEHIHEHIHVDEHHHDHDDHHHHHDEHYDEHHSEHYNYHHGLADDDDHHHHHHERDLVNVAALNNDSPSNNKVNIKNKKINKINKSSKKIGKINKCKGSHFHCNQHKRDENAGTDADGEDEETDSTRLVRRRKNYNNNGNRYNNNNGYRNKNNSGYKYKQGGDNKNIKAQTEISTGGFKRTGVLPGEMKPGLSARHHDHHDEHDWEHHDHEHYHEHDDVHVHEHIHSHEHKRDLSARRHDHDDEHVHMHIHEDEHHDHHHHHNDKRRHSDHDDDAWLDEMTYHREWRNDHAHIHIHEHDHGHYHDGHHHHHHDKRQATEKGVPGFVEVANTLAGTTLAKSVAGLVFSKGPDPNASGFLLGTSDTQSTQFYLVPNQDSSIETTQSVNATMDSPDESSKMYQLRIPVLDSKTFESNDYCATFDILPPSPMTMAPCKYKEGFSQLFRYNATTGELTPVYPPTDSQPKPMNAAVRYSEPQVMAAKFPVSDNQVPAEGAIVSAATGMPSASSASSSDTASSTADAATSTEATATDASSSSAAAPSSTSSATPSEGFAPADAPKVSLFFIPASTYASSDKEASASSSQSTTSSSTVPSTADAPLFSAAPAQAKIVAPSDGNQDWSSSSDDSGVVTTTVSVTSTMDADSAQATPATSSSSDWASTDASTSESQAWTNTDGPTQ